MLASNKKRLFVAIDPPVQVQQSLSSLCYGLPIYWTDPEQLHITLRFLGEVSASRLEAIEEVLGTVEMAAFWLRIQGVGYFGCGKNQTVLWAGSDGSPELGALYYKVGRALHRIGFPYEKRPFHPHLTLGRPKNIAAHKLLDYIRLHNDFSTEAFRIDSFSLYASRLDPQGARHSKLKDYALSR